MTDDTPPEPEEGQEPPYEVGYGKPPKHTQFKKGNKKGKGRPRGSRNLKSIVQSISLDKVPAQINGKTMKLPRIELVLRQLAQKAAAGDLRAINQLVQLYERYGPVEDDGPIPDDDAAFDLETIVRHLKLQGMVGDE